ncbi:MAG: transglycosylase SLT domain-containing protein [Prevotella sp.]|nr:transglycosylase SLT domain-containing protein [Prevotella sp.]
MKKLQTLAATMILVFSTPAWAQYENTEITVTDEQGKQEIIDLPEGMTQDVDSLLSLFHTQAYLQPDEGCNLPDVNPVYDKDTYVQRLGSLPTVMEMAYNNAVMACIDRYTNRLRRSVSIMLGAANFYMPIFEQALESYGIPLELKYLPVIESALNPNAVSRVGATGLWQFMLATGKQYGLEVNSLYDERRDPVKSSYAAAHYLSDLYKIFGDWNLVIAAYNCGPENVSKAMHRAGGSKDYWQIYPYLPRETRGYVPAFIAANYVMNYYCEHNICPMITTLPTKTDTVMVNRDVHFEQIAQVLGVDINQIKELNPQYRRNIINGSTRPMDLRLPANIINNFIDQEEAIYAYNAEELLTKRTEVDVNEAQMAALKRPSKSSRSAKGASRVTVRKGDTLGAIAKRNHTTVAKLRSLNRIKGNTIKAGQKIRVK